MDRSEAGKAGGEKERRNEANASFVSLPPLFRLFFGGVARAAQVCTADAHTKDTAFTDLWHLLTVLRKRLQGERCVLVCLSLLSPPSSYCSHSLDIVAEEQRERRRGAVGQQIALGSRAACERRLTLPLGRPSRSCRCCSASHLASSSSSSSVEEQSGPGQGLKSTRCHCASLSPTIASTRVAPSSFSATSLSKDCCCSGPDLQRRLLFQHSCAAHSRAPSSKPDAYRFPLPNAQKTSRAPPAKSLCWTTPTRSTGRCSRPLSRWRQRSAQRVRFSPVASRGPRAAHCAFGLASTPLSPSPCPLCLS